MSSHASSAGGGEARVGRKLVETDAVDVMIAIRSNFFYTRPCPAICGSSTEASRRGHQDKVLLIEARSAYPRHSRINGLNRNVAKTYLKYVQPGGSHLPFLPSSA